jgi:uncharacterized protein YebE (UPF0316 family)
MNKLLITFIILNIFNVIIQTVKSIATVKCGKTAAAIINAVAYGLYTIVTVYMLCELDLWVKALIVAVCNLIGVYIVKLIEEKSRKDKLWKVEATVKGIDAYLELGQKGISCNCLTSNRKGEYVINCFCPTQKDSVIVKEILNKYNAKYFVSESKTL